MKTIISIISFILVCLVEVSFAQKDTDLNIGLSKLRLDNTGRLITLNTTNRNNALDASRSSFLLMLQPHGENQKPLAPISMRVSKLGDGRKQLIFGYDDGFEATVDAVEKEQYLRLALIKVQPLDQVAKVTWGPINTNMKGSIGGYLGLIREDNFSIGMLSLDVNTDGLMTNGGHYHVATYNGTDGARLLAESWDHTKDGLGQDGYLAKAFPVTVEGSSIAIFACDGQKELDQVEIIALAEKMPYPMINGVWNKRSNNHILPQIWGHYTQDNFDQYLKLSNAFGAKTIANFHDLFGNWGHFEANPKLYPNGIEDLRKTVDKSTHMGVGHVMYTLSTFLLKRNGVDEPFISPHIHQDMQHIAPAGVLSEAINKEAEHLVFINKFGLVQALNKVKHVRVGSELIERKEVQEREGFIHFTGIRGALGTKSEFHAKGKHIYAMQQHFYNSFCPGSIALQDSVTDNMARVAREAGFPQVTIDGYESCLPTGHGAYAKNRFSSRLFQKVGNPNLRITPSNFGNYDWHLMSYVSWGELDREKGFRGTMLDYRLRRAIQLRNNLMPGKLGQFYPEDAKSEEDFHWLMGLATGWGMGVDFHIEHLDANVTQMHAYAEVVNLWTEARLNGFFTEKQLLEFRETDRQYRLSRNENGGYKLEFLGRWRHTDMEELPSTVFKISSKDNAEVVASTIDWGWTHNPGIYLKGGVSDDLIAIANGKEAIWNVTYPTDDRFYFVIRLPHDAPSAVRNPTIILNEMRMVVPVTLQPGDYIATAHDGARVGIYNSQHEIIGESYIQCLQYRLPTVKANTVQSVSLNAESVDATKKSTIYMNLRTRVPIPSKYGEF